MSLGLIKYCFIDLSSFNKAIYAVKRLWEIHPQHLKKMVHIWTCLLEVVQCSAEFGMDALIIQFNNVNGDNIVCKGIFKNHLESMTLADMVARAKRRLHRDLGIAGLRPIKLCGQAGKLLNHGMRFFCKNIILKPKYRVRSKIPEGLVKFLHHDVIPNNVDHGVSGEPGGAPWDYTDDSSED